MFWGKGRHFQGTKTGAQFSLELQYFGHMCRRLIRIPGCQARGRPSGSLHRGYPCHSALRRLIPPPRRTGRSCWRRFLLLGEPLPSRNPGRHRARRLVGSERAPWVGLAPSAALGTHGDCVVPSPREREHDLPISFAKDAAPRATGSSAESIFGAQPSFNSGRLLRGACPGPALDRRKKRPAKII